MADVSPMMGQYLEIKKNNPDTIIFFRLGDFYEMFYDDAEEVSKVLELTLTSRAAGNNERAPMCGIPFHSADSYLARLVEKGYKIAICEQLEDPKLTKGLVKRDIVRVITKGSVIESSMLDESKNNYLSSICFLSSSCGICFIDVSTGVLNLTTFKGKGFEKKVVSELGVYSPSEILLNSEAADCAALSSFINNRLQASCELLDDEYYSFDSAFKECVLLFGKEKLDSLALSDDKLAVLTIGSALKYLKFLYKTDVLNINDINVFTDGQFMKLDFSTKRNLEIIETMRSGEKKGSLLWVLDKTSTAMGKRLLRSWLEKPLINLVQISKRQNAVDALFHDSITLDQLHEELKSVFDIERLVTRIVLETANAKDLNSLRQTLEHVPEIKNRLKNFKSGYLKSLESQIDILSDVHDLIDASINPDAPFSLRDGDLIKRGFNAELDELIDIQKGGKHLLSKLEAAEKERTGIPKLRIGFNKVFGYYIEVTNSYKSMVPENYIRKQTLTNAERYITEELKEHENKVLGAQERSVKLEFELFSQIRSKIASQCTRLQLTASALAAVDVLTSLALAAIENNYICPVITDKPVIDIKSGRHPVVELMLTDSLFVPNDTYLDCDENRTAIITGPNMAGKSTYMRQVALICLMAQIGSFVPAESATLGIVDNIFTRVGASDDLASGQSTFMVEMSEVSNIIKSATKNSLIILDEVGRGTSTFDGMSIARGCLEYINDKRKIGAKTLFSTHYHELTELENEIQGVKNYNISVKKRGDSIIFLRKIVRGKAAGSYGLEVAKLAGLPSSVINRAKSILASLEDENNRSVLALSDTEGVDAYSDMPSSLSLTSTVDDRIIDELKNIDTDTLTPLEALTMLNDLVNKARSNGEF